MKWWEYVVLVWPLHLKNFHSLSSRSSLSLSLTHTLAGNPFKLLPWQPVSIPPECILQDWYDKHIHTHMVKYTRGNPGSNLLGKTLCSVHERFCAKRYVSCLLGKENDRRSQDWISSNYTVPSITTSPRHSIKHDYSRPTATSIIQIELQSQWAALISYVVLQNNFRSTQH